MQKSYFTIEELCKSNIALQKKLDNTPDDETVSRLNRLIEFLNPLREAWGSPITVSSGYRSSKLNKLVGGVANSQHLLGNAVDLIPSNGKMKEFQKFLIEYLKDKKFDQCILEKSKTAEWVHLGLYKDNPIQRNQIFTLKV